MKRIEILKINDPFNFWITEKDPNSLQTLISEQIEKESINDDVLTEEHDLSSLVNNKTRLVSVYIEQSNNKQNKYFRGQVMDIIRTFGSKIILTCYLLDIGHSINVELINCRIIQNETLVNLSPFAKKCSLYNIKSNE
jgi:hypothetical protein